MDSKIEPVAWPPLIELGRCIAQFVEAVKTQEGWSAGMQATYDRVNQAMKDEYAALAAAEQRGRESERERCAKIADDGAEQADRAFRGFTALNAAAFMHGRAQAVAAAIRKGE